MLEAFPEEQKDTKQIIEIATRNVAVCKNVYGEKSFFLMMPLYALYTAQLHDAAGTGSSDTILEMSQLVLDDKQSPPNQFLFKVVLIDTIMLSQAQDAQSMLRVQTNLNETLKQTIDYCEGDKDHPFLEEVLSVFANYFENTQSFENSLIMWSKLLRIQQNLLG